MNQFSSWKFCVNVGLRLRKIVILSSLFLFFLYWFLWPLAWDMTLFVFHFYSYHFVMITLCSFHAFSQYSVWVQLSLSIRHDDLMLSLVLVSDNAMLFTSRQLLLNVLYILCVIFACVITRSDITNEHDLVKKSLLHHCKEFKGLAKNRKHTTVHIISIDSVR